MALRASRNVAGVGPDSPTPAGTPYAWFEPAPGLAVLALKCPSRFFL